MKITYELDLDNFGAWSGARDTLARIRREGKIEEAEQLLEDCFSDGMTETQLNDLLWFEDEWIFESLGIRTETQIQTELEEAEVELEDLEEEMEELLADALTEEERNGIRETNQQDIEDLIDRIAELKEELENL